MPERNKRRCHKSDMISVPMLRVPYLAAFALLGFSACGGGAHPSTGAEPETSPLPTAGIAGQEVAVYPLTLVVSEESLGWSEQLQPRREALDHADSLIAALLTERAPEVVWVLPEALRRASSRAPGMLANPDQMGTALLRSPLDRVPDPLRSQLRTLTGMAAGRHALLPASLVFLSDSGGLGRAELTLAIVDVRTASVQWRTVAIGVGDDPWVATWEALKSLVPGLP
jgi:hypothetical protein